MFCARHVLLLRNIVREGVHRSLYVTPAVFNSDGKKDVAVRGSFESVEDKTKETYLEMIGMFSKRDVHRRGHVEFIYSALKNMESFNVHKDLEVYKALIDVLPKGKFIPQNVFQAEFMHYPKQQQCVIDLLEQMEDNGVMPDYEMEDMLMNVFGRRGYPLRKFWRMMYWMPKFKNLSPWPVPNPPPDDALELAKMAVSRIASADVRAASTVYLTSEIADSIDDTWIVSSQSPTQKELLEGHDVKEPIYVEGAFRVWLRNKSVDYFVLRGPPKPLVELDEDTSDDVSNIKVPSFNELPTTQTEPTVSVHEQSDGTVYALCATGTSSRDSLLSWVRHLEKDNPNLTRSPVVFTLRTAEREVAVVDHEDKGAQKKTIEEQ